MNEDLVKIKRLAKTFLYFYEKGYKKGYMESQKDAVEFMLFEGNDSEKISSVIGIPISEVENIKQNFIKELGV